MNKLSKNKIISDSKIDAMLNAHQYSEATFQLHYLQKKEWKTLSDNINALKNVKQKSFQINGYKIYCQYNPQRLLSSSADVFNEVIKKRNCFLCTANLPVEQKGFLIDDNFILLCNPFPIFNHHFTIASVTHQPQLLSNHFLDLLFITEKLNEGFTVFYNGSQCGASAPDHLHFQAVEKIYLPIFGQINFIKSKFGKLIQSDPNFSAYSVDDGLRKFILLESLNQEVIKNYFHKIYSALNHSGKKDFEPMLNILCAYGKKNGWTVLIFLRSRHRSSHYFKRGESKILISPASVDVEGVCILPREEDFVKISPELIKEIFSEIFPSAEEFNKIISAIE